VPHERARGARHATTTGWDRRRAAAPASWWAARPVIPSNTVGRCLELASPVRKSSSNFSRHRCSGRASAFRSVAAAPRHCSRNGACTTTTLSACSDSCGRELKARGAGCLGRENMVTHWSTSVPALRMMRLRLLVQYLPTKLLRPAHRSAQDLSVIVHCSRLTVAEPRARHEKAGRREQIAKSFRAFHTRQPGARSQDTLALPSDS